MVGVDFPVFPLHYDVIRITCSLSMLMNSAGGLEMTRYEGLGSPR
jgi:hypothetical protein